MTPGRKESRMDKNEKRSQIATTTNEERRGGEEGGKMRELKRVGLATYSDICLAAREIICLKGAGDGTVGGYRTNGVPRGGPGLQI